MRLISIENIGEHADQILTGCTVIAAAVGILIATFWILIPASLTLPLLLPWILIIVSFFAATIVKMNSNIYRMAQAFESLEKEMRNFRGLTWMETSTHQQMYNHATDIVHKAKTRLIVVQLTSSLLLGPRSKEDEKFTHELDTWIKALTRKKTSEKTCWYLYNEEATASQKKERNIQTKYVEHQKALYEKYQRKSGHRFRIVPISSEFSGRLAVGDNQTALWIAGLEDLVVVKSEDKRVADKLEYILRGVAVKAEEKQLKKSV
jgi:hypothetical protein